MMKKILIVVSLLLAFNVSSQNFYEKEDTVLLSYDEFGRKHSDTIIFDSAKDRYILFGNAIIPHSRGCVDMNGVKLVLREVTTTILDDDMPDPDSQIQTPEVQLTDQSLIVTVKCIDYCQTYFLYDAYMSNAGRNLSVVAIAYGLNGSEYCRRYYEMKYVFSKDKTSKLNIEKYEFIHR